LYSNNRNFYCAWLLCEENHSVLTKGNFYTKFSQSFKIGEKQTEEKYFEIKFTVQ